MNEQMGFKPKEVEHIKASFPKAYKAFGKFLFTPEVQNILKQAGDKYTGDKEYHEGFAAVKLMADPRALYDFFDDKNIEVHYTSKNMSAMASNEPYSTIMANDTIYSNKFSDGIGAYDMLEGYNNYTTRLQYELAAFMYAFELLEKQL